ncbi:hypothetical protein MMC13_001655, partial [Lambiella insularis]|nr:hypothetical protein [Lambiella insularis]
RAQYSLISQLVILRSCPEVLQRFLRKRNSVLLGAKVLILSRLLHTKLAEQASVLRYIDGVRSRLTKLRQRLLLAIDRQLKSPHIGSEELLEAMCAFSLATSSSAKDVLRHFHHVRADAILNHSLLSSQAETYILEALRLWVKTLQDTNAIFPRLLANVLVRLKTVPLFKDHSLWSNAQFDYEIHVPWMGDDLKNFIPYIRHDDLHSSAAAEQLAVWGPKILNTFLANVNVLLGSISSPQVIVRLRKRCLELWISSRPYFVATDKVEVLGALTSTFRAHLSRLIEAQCSGLKEISLDVITMIKELGLRKVQVSQNLWRQSLLRTDFSSGANGFGSALIRHVYGASDALNAVMNSYQKWLSSIEGWDLVIGELQRTRWDESLEDLEEDDDLDERLQDLLSKKDPQSLKAELATSLVASFSIFENVVRALAEGLEDNPNFDIRAAYLLRTLRGVRQHLPVAYTNTSFATAVIDDLQSKVSERLVRDVLLSHDVSTPQLMRGFKKIGRALWDDGNKLPVLPSPWVCRLLRALQLRLTDVGTDIWSSAAIGKVKIMLRSSLATALPRRPEGKHETNGDDQQSPFSPRIRQTDDSSMTKQIASPEPVSVDNDFIAQHLFDVSYIAEATSNSLASPIEDEFGDYCNRVQRKVTLSGSLVLQVKKNATEYWKRTSLLYAFLT